MKRLLIFLLVLACLPGLYGCEEVEKAVPSPLSWADMDAIPVASADMTEEQLRQIVLDFFRLQLTFQWTPREDFDYTIVCYDELRNMKAGTVYAGLPYQGNAGNGNLYIAMEYYDPETGRLDNADRNWQALTVRLGNQCFSGPAWAWSRVVNSNKTYAAYDSTHKNGYLIVGDYEYQAARWSETTTFTRDVCKENGEQRMFESYALVKPADGLNRRCEASHTRMVSSYPVVVRNEDGTINGDESYVLYMDQASSWKDYTTEDGTNVLIQGNIDKKTTFTELYHKYYIPFTFGELIGTEPVEPAQVTLELPEQATISALATGVITTNYPIAYVRATVTDDSGNVLYSVTEPTTITDDREMFLGKVLDLAQIGSLTEDAPLQLTVQVRVSTGQLLTAYTGTLVP